MNTLSINPSELEIHLNFLNAGNKFLPDSNNQYYVYSATKYSIFIKIRNNDLGLYSAN